MPRLNEEFEVLGRVGDKPAYFKKKGREIYGMLFHPEALNRDLLAEFLKNSWSSTMLIFKLEA